MDLHRAESFRGVFMIANVFIRTIARVWVLAVGGCGLIWPMCAQAQGLVAAYSFNQGTGSTVTDLSGNNITGTIVGATWTTQGKYGNALSFNGSTSYVDLGNPTALG